VNGFWEVVFHRRLRQHGGRLCMRRGALARFTGGTSWSTVLGHRFAHGRHFGAWRVAERERAPWQIVAASPLVPLILAARAAGRLAGTGRRRWRAAGTLPAFLTIAAAWAVGEAAGALSAAGLPRTRVLGEE
jgi:hypothetical protein